MVAAGYGPAIDIVKKYSLEVEIEQRLRDPGTNLMGQSPRELGNTDDHDD